MFKFLSKSTGEAAEVCGTAEVACGSDCRAEAERERARLALLVMTGWRLG